MKELKGVGLRIAVDLMGSDHAPDILFKGVLQAVGHLSFVSEFFVIATKPVIKEITRACRRSGHALDKIQFIPASDFITMEDSPMFAIRRKKESSLVLGLQFVKEKKVDAFVSAGNTGALITGARIIIPPLPGIDRPALLALMPTQKDPMVVVDLGGNISCEWNHLVQFAQMGAAYHSCIFGKLRPKVGLLNIGIESKKGTQELRHAYQVLEELSQKHAPLHFMGNIEGKEAFQGKVDVLVTDGFTGNVFLKTCEGGSFFFLDCLKKAYAASKIKFPPEVMQHLQKQFAYNEYPGAALCGIDGLVIKCHGDSSAENVFQGIKSAANLVQNRLIAKIKKQLKKS